MHPSTILLTLLTTLPSLIASHPATLDACPAPLPVSCGPSTNQRIWAPESIAQSLDALAAAGRQSAGGRPKAGTRAYPQQYGRPKPSDADVVAALDTIDECRTGQPGMKFFEFPLTDPVFAGSEQGGQGPDRIVAISPTPGQGGVREYTYCLTMTHRGGTGPSDPSFRPCV